MSDPAPRSAPEVAPPSSTALEVRRERRQAWGMATTSVCHVVRPATAADVLEAYAIARQRGLTIHSWGNGRSYGDAALNESNLLLDFSGMNRILAFDKQSGLLTAEPGVTLAQLERYGLPKGWWPPVVSGTMHTTLGGCIAANVHGKNNFKYGPWGDHLVRFTIVTPDGEIREVDRESDPELFHYAVGGFGLLGAFVSITVQMKRVHSGRLRVLPVVGEDLDEMFRHFERFNSAGFDYVVGWMDAFAGGRALGRGQIHAARYLDEGEDPEGVALMSAEHQQLPSRFFGVVPKSALWRLAQPFAFRLGMRLINAARFWWMKLGSKEEAHLETHTRFNHLLDFVPNWKWFYKPGGLIQYQLFLPKERAREVMRRVLELGRETGLESWLVVMKRHRADAFPLSHAVDGYSFAMDFPVTERNRARLYQLTRTLERMVVESGGRFYFAKDSVVSPEAWRRSVGDEAVGRFLALKKRVDPDDLIQGNLFRRVIAPLRHDVPLIEEALEVPAPVAREPQPVGARETLVPTDDLLPQAVEEPPQPAAAEPAEEAPEATEGEAPEEGRADDADERRAQAGSDA